MALPETAQALCNASCARIDADHPGALAALHLVGWIVLDDFRPGSSDVDFIAVLGRPLTADQVTVLHSQISQQFARPNFVGIYVDADAPALDPCSIASGLRVVDGRVRGPDRDERHPVT